tara:strand:- start:513 stop:2618 length:2106 start_codon:yes stop_codon:yes gene_type:complete
MKDRDLNESILNILSKSPDYTYNYKQIASILGIKDSFIRKRIVIVLSQLEKDGHLNQISRGKYQIKNQSKELKGNLQFVSKGGAYFISPKLKNDIYIHPSNTNNALNGDLVLIKTNHYKGKLEGKVIKIIERVKKEYSGIIEKTKDICFFIPDDRMVKTHFYIDKKHINGAKNGQKVKVKFISWPKNVKSPQAAVTEIIGNPGELNVEMNAILSEYGFPIKFPKKVENEVALIDVPNYNIEAKKRLDLRNKTTFTIDPVDAKDFDDALSIDQLKDGIIEVGVHIADVGHFVKEKTYLDDEAYFRGNSVYLVDRVIPMLPEKLSNQLCSLRPNEDKLTFSAIFHINQKFEVINTWFGKTIIHSNNRFSYEEAQEIIEGEEHSLSKEINTLNNIAKILRADRLKDGALNIESSEVRFEIDEKGEPIGTFLKISQEAHQLIEEFMLLANKQVAIKMGKPSKKKLISPFIYRIHDDPSEEKINDLNIYLESMGYKMVREKNKPISFSLNTIMKQAKEKKELHLISPMVIRSMSKAVYSSENIGHYGLAFQYYTHFTSPIRRYADLLVHRALLNALENPQKHLTNAPKLEASCTHLSKMEKQATDAERASVKYMQVKYLSKKTGEQFSGLISGITDWGIYVELDENKCEGLVSISTMKDDQYFYDKELQMMVGYHNQNNYKIGQEVEVIVKKTDLYKRQIDFKLVN